MADGGVLEVTDCSSDGDRVGCAATEGAMLVGDNVHVWRSAKDGFCVSHGGQALLTECASSGCVANGMHAGCHGSQLTAEGCVARDCRGRGYMVKVEAVASLSGCSSSGNAGAGYFAATDGTMIVSCSSSDGDGVAERGVGDSTQRGAVAVQGGVLHMEGLTVDGSYKCYELP